MTKKKTTSAGSARRRGKPAAPAGKPAPAAPLTVWLFFIFSWLIGWWLAYDGVRQRVTGDYTRLNGRLGPWAALVSSLAIDPLSLSWFFVVLGLGFVASSFGLYLRQRWGLNVGLAASLLGLFYLGFGTPVAVICLVVLLLPATRAYVSSRYSAA